MDFTARGEEPFWALDRLTLSTSMSILAYAFSELLLLILRQNSLVMLILSSKTCRWLLSASQIGVGGGGGYSCHQTSL